MVIELSEVQFGLKSYACFQNRTSVQREYNLKSCDFRPKLHNTKFNYHFITPIFKFHSFLSISIFIYPLQETWFHFHFAGLKKDAT